jgi:ubiquinone/menaquinone biosynthesis C-methylase UbiE
MSRTYDKTQASAEFNRWSESYDRSILQRLLFGPSHRAILARVRARFGDEPVRILDVGCGTGVFASVIHRERPEATVVGVDLTAGMLERGRERWHRLAGHASPVQGDSERLPFASGAFDVVTCSNSFHHYPDQAQAIVEMHRVLRPGGVLLLVDGYRDDPYGWFIYDVCVATVEGNVHHASRRRVRSLMAEAGFAEVRQKVHYGFAPFLLTEAVAGHAGRVPAEAAEVAAATA